MRPCFLPSFVEFRSAVSLQKSKMSRLIRGKGGHLSFFFWSVRKKNMVEDVETLRPVKFHWIPFSGFRAEVENASANRRPGRPSCFFIGPKNKNLVEDVEVLLPIKFRWIKFKSFREEVENVSANQRPGRPSCFSDRPEKHKLGRGCLDLASWQVSLNSVQHFQSRSRNFSANQRPGRPSCFFLIGPKITILVEGVEILLPVKFRWILLSGFRGEVENVIS